MNLYGQSDVAGASAFDKEVSGRGSLHQDVGSVAIPDEVERRMSGGAIGNCEPLIASTS